MPGVGTRSQIGGWSVKGDSDRIAIIRRQTFQAVESADVGSVLWTARAITAQCPSKDHRCELEAIFGAVRRGPLPVRLDTGQVVTVPGIRFVEECRWTDMHSTAKTLLTWAAEGSNGGDCFPLEQKVIVRNKGTGFYELQPLGDLRHLWPMYDALSYDFSGSKWIFKPITAWTYRGERETFDVKLHNGARFSCTPDHVFWGCKWSKNQLKVEEYPLSDLPKANTGRKHHHPAVLAARQIPLLGASDADEALAYIKGIYASEGFSDPHHVRIAQDKQEVREKIEAALASMGASFRPSKRSKHSYYDIHGSAREILEPLGSNSFNKRPAWDCLSGDGGAVRAYMEGNFDGDGCCVQRKGRDSFFNQYTTSSEDLANGLRLGLMLLGQRQWWYKQLRHGGVGTKPIYRIYEHLTEDSKRDAVVSAEFPGLRTVSVTGISPGAMRPVCDISVAETHNFVLADGTIVHNCDDHVILVNSLLLVLGWLPGAVIASKDGRTFDHIFPAAGFPKDEPNIWVPMDTTIDKPLGWWPPRNYVRRMVVFGFTAHPYVVGREIT